MKAQVSILMCLLVAISLVAGCFEKESSSMWAFGDDDALGIRLGTEVAENVEVGISSMWWPEDDGDTQLYGAYALYYLPEDAVNTYIGVQTPLNNNYDQIAPVAGVVFDEVFFLEYQYKNWGDKEAQEEDKIVFGIRLRF